MRFKKVENIEEITSVFLVGSVCITDLVNAPSDLKSRASNGKEYIKIVINNSKTMKFGNTHEIKLNPSKEEKARGIQSSFIGNLSEWKNIDEDSGKENQKNIHSSERPGSNPIPKWEYDEDVDTLPF